MIVSYRDKRTRDFAAGKRVNAFSGIERPARLKLDRLEAATVPRDEPSNVERLSIIPRRTVWELPRSIQGNIWQKN